MPSRAIGTCRSCGADIIWARNDKTQKAMPFDPTPIAGGQWRLVVLNGDRIAVHDASIDQGYVTHFATCPNAAQHRKPR